ncbi:MAG: hypothetical protein DI536_34795 [Archangium gephyra]|uniref:Uncharacterized protein n=1 Tax=Archangium gephyra TaxID=48 RepID=A0A2W5STP0_9BACT|nr:MAG: hypothetical protein DI536_34795 [Archangium gephyra]
MRLGGPPGNFIAGARAPLITGTRASNPPLRHAKNNTGSPRPIAGSSSTPAIQYASTVIFERCTNHLPHAWQRYSRVTSPVGAEPRVCCHSLTSTTAAWAQPAH